MPALSGFGPALSGSAPSVSGFGPAPRTMEGDTLFAVRPGGGRHGLGRPAHLAGVGVALVAVIALVVGMVGMVGLGGGSGTPQPVTSSGIVLTSAQTTLATKTADLHMTMAIQVPGAGQITASGYGAVDFANDAAQATITYAGSPQLAATQIQEVFTGQNLYLSIPEISQLVAGKSWISTPVAAANSITPGSSNPAAMFQVLTSEGDKVTPLGPSLIGGEAVHGFHVAIGLADLLKRAEADVPASVVQEVKSMFGRAGIQMSVYVGDDTHLVRRITFSMHLSIRSTVVSAQATEDISNYGAPVSISAPPADQVISLPQFEQAALAGQTVTR
jgi:hypothetical protein